MKSLQQQTSSYRYFVPLLRIKAENVVTDRLTDTQTYGTSTVTLAGHARPGLTTQNTVEALNKGHVGTRSFILYREVSFIRRLKWYNRNWDE